MLSSILGQMLTDLLNYGIPVEYGDIRASMIKLKKLVAELCARCRRLGLKRPQSSLVLRSSLVF